jgi:hypothetical protein
MKRRTFCLPLVTLFLTLFYACFLLSANPYPLQSVNEQTKKQPKAPQKKAADSMSGCVDEQDGNYVLVDDRTLMPIANLEANGFPKEGFAKHMGQKVTVRGILSSGGTTPVFKVSSVETLRDTCKPQQ